MKLPTLDACYGLALGLHAYREWFSSGARTDDTRQRFQAALNELAATIPAVRSESSDWLNRLRSNRLLSGAEMAQANVKVLDDLGRAVISAR